MSAKLPAGTRTFKLTLRQGRREGDAQAAQEGGQDDRLQGDVADTGGQRTTLSARAASEQLTRRAQPRENGRRCAEPRASSVDVSTSSVSRSPIARTGRRRPPSGTTVRPARRGPSPVSRSAQATRPDSAPRRHDRLRFHHRRPVPGPRWLRRRDLARFHDRDRLQASGSGSIPRPAPASGRTPSPARFDRRDGLRFLGRLRLGAGSGAGRPCACGRTAERRNRASSLRRRLDRIAEVTVCLSRSTRGSESGFDSVGSVATGSGSGSTAPARHTGFTGWAPTAPPPGSGSTVSGSAESGSAPRSPVPAFRPAPPIPRPLPLPARAAASPRFRLRIRPLPAPARPPPSASTGSAVSVTFVPQPDASSSTLPRARSPSQATVVSGSVRVIRISAELAQVPGEAFDIAEFRPQLGRALHQCSLRYWTSGFSPARDSSSPRRLQGGSHERRPQTTMMKMTIRIRSETNDTDHAHLAAEVLVLSGSRDRTVGGAARMSRSAISAKLAFAREESRRRRGLRTHEDREATGRMTHHSEKTSRSAAR